MVAEVLDLPCRRDLHGGRAVELDVGVHTRVDGRHEGERLERRAHLSVRRGRQVVLARAVVLSADHGQDVAGAGVYRDERRAELVVSDVIEHLVAGVLRRSLVRGCDRGVDLQPALEDRVRREVLEQELLDVVGEVRVGARGVRELALVQDEVLGLGGVMLLLCDVTGFEHAVEHRVAALLCGVRMHRGIVVGGRLGQADERGRLGEGEVARVLVEVDDARGLDAIGTVAVVDGVEVHVEDLVLRVLLLHLDGDVGLADLALYRVIELLVREDGVAHELLGDRGRTLGAARQGHDDGSDDALGIDAVVAVEALVLGVDGPLDHVVRDLGEVDGAALLKVVARDLVAVGVIDRRGLGDQVSVSRGVVR